MDQLPVLATPKALAQPSQVPADRLAAAFLLGFGPSTRAAYARDLADWWRLLADVEVEPSQ